MNLVMSTTGRRLPDRCLACKCCSLLKAGMRAQAGQARSATASPSWSASIPGRIGVSSPRPGLRQTPGPPCRRAHSDVQHFKALARPSCSRASIKREEQLERRVVLFEGRSCGWGAGDRKARRRPGMTVAELCDAAVDAQRQHRRQSAARELRWTGVLTAFARSLGDQVTRLDQSNRR